MSAVAVPPSADVIGDTGTVGDCVRAKVRFCIGWVRRADTAWKPSERPDSVRQLAVALCHCLS
jgi:hypothetical protein